MANQLKMAQVHAIEVLRARGWSFRRIARELGIHRETVARYLALARGSPAKPAKVIAGSENPPDSEPAKVITGEPASRSRCEPLRPIVLAKLEQGLSAQRIWQDLRDEHGFTDSYQSVQRFARQLQDTHPLPFRRMECAPGEQAQIDFGAGAPIITPEDQSRRAGTGIKTRRRQTHIFRIVLSHSRKAYSEVVYRQTTEQFIRCIENAFWYFGGVPRALVIDNLKAAVSQADLFDPELNPKIQSFCEHYGTIMVPTRPRTPRHKGKIERNVGYAKGNALKGRTFGSLAEQNRHLLQWEQTVADNRIHGTTQQQVKKCFEEAERPTLLPLPPARFPSFNEGRRKVNRDGHVEVDKAYYSVPPEYLGREVWARWDSRLVRIFNSRFEQIAIHAKNEPGRFSTQNQHIDNRKRSGVERGAAYNLNKASLIGPHTGRWAEQMVQQRGIEGVRVLMGLLSLSKRHPANAIERACETALSHGAYRLRTIRTLIQRQGDHQEQFEFIDEHPIIRSLSDYGDLVHAAFHEEHGP